MAGLNYLEGQNDNLHAVRSMGSTFSNAVIGMSQMKQRQRQIQQELLMKEAYLQLAREKEANDQTLAGAQIEHLNSGSAAASAALQQSQRIGRMKGQAQMGPDIMSIVNDPTSGPQLMTDLRASGVAPQGEFQIGQEELLRRIAMAVASQVYGTAASSPASAARLSMPVVTGPNQTGRDPFDPSSVLFTNPPADISPYQQQALEATKQYHGDRLQQQQQQFDIRQQADNERLTETSRHNKEMEQRPSGRQPNAVQQRLREQLGKDKSTTGTSGDFVLMFNPAGQKVKVPKGMKPPTGYTLAQ